MTPCVVSSTWKFIRVTSGFRAGDVRAVTYVTYTP